jgi:hypothetical protein
VATLQRDWCQRKKPWLAVGIFGLVFLGNCPGSRAQCTSKSGETLWVRLVAPLSSYRGKAGERVLAIVIESPPCNGAPAIPVGSVVQGEVASARKVGMGFVHETASMRVEFRTLILKDGSEIAVSSRVLEVDNARETVKDGTILGVNATDTPQGRITSRLKHLPTWNPYSDLTLLVYRAAFPIFPEPEIYLPRGTDVKLQLTAPLQAPANLTTAALRPFVDRDQLAVMGIMAGDLPARTTTSNGQAADLVNVAILGTQEQMDAAFQAAGWEHGDPTSTSSVMREMHAFLAFKNYPGAPISKQLMEGAAETTTWEKGLDSYEKREHLRLWERNDLVQGQTVWIGAMARETGATLSVKQHKFIHHIERDMDQGRAMLVRDLNLAGCVASVAYLPRPGMARSAMNATGDPMRTDGSLAVVQLKDCENPVFEGKPEARAMEGRPHSKLARYLRMQVLSFRSDLIRGNLVYGTFDLTRMALRARRHRAEEVALARQTKREREPASESAAGVTALGGAF